MPIVQHHDEVREVLVFLAVERVRNGEAEVLVLHVAEHLFHVLQGLRHLLFPGAGIGDDMGDVALVGACGIDSSRRVEIHIPGRADGVVRLQERLEAGLGHLRLDDRLIDTVRGIVSELHQQQELWKCVVLQRHTLVEPLLGNRHKLRKQPRAWVAVFVTEVFL
jgi:hypothetical protein